MKIVHLLGWYFPESTGGTEVYVAGLAARQRADGHAVSVAAPLSSIADAVSYQHDEIDVFRFPLPARPRRDEVQGLSPVSGTAVLHRHLDVLRPDIVHFHTLMAGLGVFEVEAARRAGARVVVTNHLPGTGYVCQRGSLMRWGRVLCDGVSKPIKCGACELQNRGMPRAAATVVASIGSPLGELPRALLPQRLGSALGMPQLIRDNQERQRRVLSLADRFVVLNRYTHDVLIANGAPRAKLAINYLGYSDARLTRKAGPRNKPTTLPVVIGFVGRLVAIKGVNEMLRAIESIPDSVPLRFEFRGVVNDAESAALADRIRAIAARKSNVRLEPPVVPGEVGNVIAGYDVLCIPSTSFENGPTVMSEAHGVGTPIIGSNIGSIAEIVVDGISGRLLPPGDWLALAEAFKEVAADPAGTIDRWRSNLPTPRTMDQIATEYSTLYSNIASGEGTVPRSLPKQNSSYP